MSSSKPPSDEAAKNQNKDLTKDRSNDPVSSKSKPTVKRSSKKRSRKRIGKRERSKSSNETARSKVSNLPATEPAKPLQSATTSKLPAKDVKQITQTDPENLTDTTIEVKIQIKPSPQADGSLEPKKTGSREVPKLESKSVKSLPGRVEGVLQRRSNEQSGNDTLPIVPFNSLNQNLLSRNKLKADLIDRIASKFSKTTIKTTARDPLSLGPEKSRSGKECRICLQLIEDETNSIQPCACTGSQAFVHKHCLHEWIRIRGSNRCDVCNNEYSGLNLVKRHRGFIDWITANPLVFGYLVTGFVVGFFFFYILFIGYLEYKTSDGLVVNSLRILLLVVTIIYTVLFSVVSVALITKGVSAYLAWRRENYTVTLDPLPSQLLGGLTGPTIISSNRLAIDRATKTVKQDVNDLKSRSLLGEGLSRHQGLAQGYKI